MSWRRYFRRAKWDRDRLEEIESYVRIETDENLARGMQPDAAREAARRKFGNRTLIREEIYKMNTIGFLDTLVRNLRYTLRGLRRNPGFTTVALLTLAIGIGANTAVFSVVNSVLLKPLPYPKSEELVAVRQTAPGASGLGDVAGDLRLSASMYLTYAEQNRTFQAIGVWAPNAATVTGLAEPEQVRTVSVSDGLLEALEVPPAVGRWLTRADQQPGSQPTLMLGYGYWQRRFGGDKSVIGSNIMVDSLPRQIVGVMPKGFRIVSADPELILPAAFDRSRTILAGFGYQCIARLRTGATLRQADADIARMVPIWMSSWPAPFGINPRIYESWRIAPAVRSLKQDVLGNVGDALWMLMGIIGIVMVIACANVANLLLVRGESRQQELAIRAALGAGWGRIVWERLHESILLALIGGAFGLALADQGLRVLVAMGPATLPRLNEISIDFRALAFALGISLVSGVLFGSIAVLKYARISNGLRAGARTCSASRDRHSTRNILVVAQVALALLLLVSSGLIIRTFQALRAVEPGFTHAERVQTLRISIPSSLAEAEQVQTPRISIPSSLAPEAERVARIENDVLDRLAAIPGVSSVAFANEIPMEDRGSDWDAIRAKDKSVPAGEIPPLRVFKYISPGLFQTAGTRLIAGRDYTWDDLYGRRPVVIVSENLARELWGAPAAAIGKQIGSALPDPSWREVIGVVQDVYNNGVQQHAPAIVYWPALMANFYDSNPRVVRSVTYMIRSTRAGTGGLIKEVQTAVWSVNSSLPLASVQIMQEIYDQSMARTSFTLVMMAIAGAMALLLGVVGIYGVISYAVSQRNREIGIRMALGAQPGALKRMFIQDALVLAGAGMAIGLSAATGLTRFMRSLLFGVGPLDPVTFAAVPMILAIAAVLASYLPARRAAAVDPVEALKSE